MSATQLLNLIISATDRASSVIGGIDNKLKGLGGTASGVKSQTSGLSDSIAFGMVKAQAAIGLVTSAYGQLTANIAEASSLQLENMGAAQTFASLTGQSFDQGAVFIDNLNAKLAKTAATLPGATKDYTALARAIQDNVVEPFKDPDGQLRNMKGFEDSLVSIAESYGVLSAAANVPVSNTALGLSKALGGASIAELRNIQTFEKNPVILGELEKRMTQAGAKSLRELDARSRIKLIKEVGEKFVTGEFKQRAALSVDGLLQSFKSSLFDPNTGVFGLMRDLDPAKNGVQSAFGSINSLINSVLGDGGLFATIGALMAQLGLTADPMVGLRDGVEWVNGWVIRLNGFLGGFKGKLSGGDLLTKAGEFIGGIGSQASEFFNFAINEIGAFLTTLNPQKSAEIGQAAGAFLGRLTGQIGEFFVRLDYGAVIALLAQLGVQLLAVAGGAIGGFLGQTMVETVRLGGIAVSQIGKAFNNFNADLGKKIGDMVKSVFDAIKSWIAQIPQRVVSSIASNPIGAVAQVMTNRNPITGATDAVARATTGKGLMDLAGGLFGGIKPKYMGHIPTAANGLFAAAAMEARNMPSGAGLAIANTSEAILRPDQLRNLVNGAVATGAQGGMVFSPTINIQGGGDAESIARETLRYLQIFFDEHMQGQMA
jgi:hypothetical protein